MPPRASEDLKARIPNLQYELGHSVPTICDLLGIHKTLIYHTLSYYCMNNTTCNNNVIARQGGRPCILDLADVCFIKALLTQQHCLYLNKIRDEHISQRGIHVSIPTLARTLCHLLITHKHVSVQALERNDIL
jgi:hypothetical protein